MTCINQNHIDYKALLKATGKDSFTLELDVAAWQEQHATDLFPTAQELYPEEISLDYYTDEDFKKMSEEYDNFLVEEYEYLSKPNEISYKLKAVEILNTTKAKKTFEKGEKNSWTLNKILTELQIPKEQRELILEFGLDKRTDILERLKSLQFSVEINTSRDISLKPAYLDEGQYEDTDSAALEEFTLNGIYYRNHGLADYPTKGLDYQQITYEEFKKAREKYLLGDGKPSQYYARLSVRGGTNYTEQEIATPQIVPAIKGHAQFATDNGIGWFRSDDKGVGGEQYTRSYWDSEKNEEVFINDFDSTGIKPTKTRRILEVQSDLFQKGRDLPDLISDKRIPVEFNVGNNPYGNKDEFPYAVFSPTGEIWDFYKTEEEAKEVVFSQSTNKNPKNEFLQLLNKNSNWVTFFIKGIVQDSEKRGYEKVLFPSGDTASKVEGHTTLEEFKKQKEDRVKELKNVYTSIFNNVETTYNNDVYNYKDLTINGVKQERPFILAKLSNILGNEIRQLEGELDRLERDGLAALKPIWNFYENVVSKITKKLYNSETVTDEYGNTWQEITLVEKNVVPLPEDLNDFINFDKICL